MSDLRPGRDLVDLGRRRDEEGHFVIEEKAAHVHVGRADDGELVVEDDGLGVEHDGRVEQDAPAGVVQIAQVAGPGEVGGDVVGVAAARSAARRLRGGRPGARARASISSGTKYGVTIQIRSRAAKTSASSDS